MVKAKVDEVQRRLKTRIREIRDFKKMLLLEINLSNRHFFIKIVFY
jgi:hypothetical protein